jgi:hypothetical protein
VCEPFQEVRALSLTFSLPEVEERLAQADREAQEVERRRAALQKIAEGLRELNGDAPQLCTPTDGHMTGSGSENLNGHPRGREAVRIIVGERPGLWRLAALRDEMRNRGWFTSAKAVEVAVTRLCATGEGRRAGKGLYEFPASNGKEGAIENERSGAAMSASA